MGIEYIEDYEGSNGNSQNYFVLFYFKQEEKAKKANVTNISAIQAPKYYKMKVEIYLECESNKLIHFKSKDYFFQNIIEIKDDTSTILDIGSNIVLF